MDERRAPAGGAAVVERDRVLDAARAFALLVVVVAHSLAWDLSTTSPMSVLDLHPGAAGWTWSLQILPLFFAAGAVTNLGSWQRRPDGFLSRRLVRLGVPALVYTAFWTAIGLPAALLVPGADLVGRFLAQLLWFLGVYAAVTAAVPWTVRWTARPVLSLGVWLAVIAVVDALRWNVHPTLGQLNLLFVWGFLHQVGLHLPALRRARPAVLLAGAASAVASAVGLAVLGPYSSSLVTYAADPEPSNLSPPTLVVALYGLGLVLVLAWLLAGVVARADGAVLAWLRRRPGRGGTTTDAGLAVALPLVLLAVTTTGFATWWGPGPLGVPTSSLLNLVLLAAVLRGLARART